MACDSEIHHRRSIRLSGYDYARPGFYFLTLCTHGLEHTFGEISECEMRPNGCGSAVAASWNDLPLHYPHIRLDEFVVMPNHVHAIIEIMDVGAGQRPAPAPVSMSAAELAPAVVSLPGAGLKPAPTKSQTRHGVPEIVRAFKTFSARQINRLRGTCGVAVWQRNYYEHIIRNRKELEMTRDYIRTNPARWDADPERWVDVGAGL